MTGRLDSLPFVDNSTPPPPTHTSRLKKLQEKYEGQPAPETPWEELRDVVQLDRDYEQGRSKRILIRHVKLPLGDISRRVIAVQGIPDSEFQLQVKGGTTLHVTKEAEKTIQQTGEGILQLPNVRIIIIEQSLNSFYRKSCI